MEPKKQKKYYLITIGITLIINFLISDTIAQASLILFTGLNISLARKLHKIRGFFLILPIVGMVNGFMVPLLIVPSSLLQFSEVSTLIYRLVFYLIIYSLFAVFYFKGKGWRDKFYMEMGNRHLHTWEVCLLCLVGMIAMIYSVVVSAIPTKVGWNDIFVEQITMQMLIMGIMSLILTITVIILIMQGNKRSYYHEKAMMTQKAEMEREKAEAANVAKSAFLSNMSHEIRTPMNVVVGMTEILLRDQHSQQTTEYLNNIRNSGNALLAIINDILDFSKIESGKMEIIEEEYEPMSMFNDLSMIFLNRIGDKDIELLYDIDKEIPSKLKGDDNRVRQIIINLVNNAIKFTEKGYVKLSVKSQKLEDSKIELSFSVEDTGQGIKEEDIDKLFGSFSQVDTKKNHHKEGTGLGLAISKQLAERMNGCMGVNSTYGEGSVFYFTIQQGIVDEKPAVLLKERVGKLAVHIENSFVRQQFMALAASYNMECFDFIENQEQKFDYYITDRDERITEEVRNLAAGYNAEFVAIQNPMLENVLQKNITILNKPLYCLNFCQLFNHEKLVTSAVLEETMGYVAPKARILIVDDNELNLKVAKGLLEPIKLQIDTAGNGKEAVIMIQEKQYDIVFMDHMMPVMDGVEATHVIRESEDERHKNIPIIALSANATSEAREMFIAEGMNDFVTKPIKFKVISKCIRKWLPKELIVESLENDKEDRGNSKEEETQVLEVLDIEGLDIEEGIKNCGSQELLVELLSDFYKIIELKCNKLESCLAEGMLRDYTIEVHALKNTARMIGAMELSDLFYQMEQLGNAGEEQEIRRRTPEVLELYRSYKEILKEYGKKEKEELVRVSYEVMEEGLMRLHDAIDDFDLDTADETMGELETYDFPSFMKPMLEQLSGYMADIAMEEVLKLTSEMCSRLQECEKQEYEKQKYEKRDESENSKYEKRGYENSAGSLIMLVDDDRISSKAVTSMLQEEYQVMVAESGKQALELLEHRRPDLILLDVHMPEMDGHEVILNLKNHPDYMDIPVIFLTSDEDENTEMQGFREGAIDFLKKPFRKGVAIQRIRRILELSYLQKNLKEEVIRQTDVAEKRRESVERMSLQMVQALANTIDAKDSYTNGHSTRVAEYSVMLAKRMGYTGRKLEQLQYAALLHDIGKIGISNEIINKTSRLSDEEYEIIKTHPGIGGRILEKISEIPDIAIGARWHHERFDGKGYPDKLAGLDIPEIARIIGVADAYDAMTSNRSYRSLLPQEVVAGEIKKGKSTQFDPDIADIMLQLIEEDKNYEMHE